jgi:hypothetical protein
MIVLAKLALGMMATAAVTGAYVFHEGVIRVDVDEPGQQGEHIHVWVPATAVSVGMRIAPKAKLQQATAKARPYLPAMRKLVHEMEKYPNVEFVDVQDATDHVRVSTVNGKVRVDVVSNDGENVHVSVPAEAIEDFVEGLERTQPGI